MAVDAAEDLEIVSDGLNRALHDLMTTAEPNLETLKSALIKTITAVGYAADAIRKTRREAGLG